MSSNVLLFLGRAFDIVWHDTTKFHGHWLSNREVTKRGGGEGKNPMTLSDSEKIGLFRIQEKVNKNAKESGNAMKKAPQNRKSQV